MKDVFSFDAGARCRSHLPFCHPPPGGRPVRGPPPRRLTGSEALSGLRGTRTDLVVKELTALHAENGKSERGSSARINRTHVLRRDCFLLEEPRSIFDFNISENRPAVKG